MLICFELVLSLNFNLQMSEIILVCEVKGWIDCPPCLVVGLQAFLP